MDDIEAEEKRDAEAGLLDGAALGGAYRLAAPEVEEAADAAGADERRDVLDAGRAGDGVAGGDHGELAELFGQGHVAEERREIRPGGGEERQASAGGEEPEKVAAADHRCRYR